MATMPAFAAAGFKPAFFRSESWKSFVLLASPTGFEPVLSP
jgi:hypothetical protein